MRVVKAKISYVGRCIWEFSGRIVDNFSTLWIAPGKCRTNPENVGLNPENVGIDGLPKTAESRTSKAFAASPRARARKQKKQESRNRAQKPARGTLRVPPASRLPLPLSSPRKRGRQVPRKPSQPIPHRQEIPSRYSTAVKSGLQKRSQANRQHSERALAGFEPPQRATRGPQARFQGQGRPISCRTRKNRL